MRPLRTIKSKLIVFTLCISLIPISIITVIYYFNSRNTVKKQILNELTTIVESKKMHIHSFVESKRGRLVDFGSDGFIRDCVEEISMKGPRVKHYTDTLCSHLVVNKKSLSTGILEIFVLDLNGKVIVSTDKSNVGKDVSGESCYTEATLKAIAGTPHYDIHFKEIVIDFSTVLMSKIGQEAIGIIVNRVKFGPQNDFGQYASSLDKNSEWFCSQLIAVNKTRIMDFSTDGFIRDSIEEIVMRDDRIVYYTGVLNNHLEKNKSPLDPDIVSVFVVSLTGEIIGSSEFGLIGKDVSNETYFTETMKNGYCMSDLRSSPVVKHGIFEMAKLIFTKDERKVAGLMVVRYDGKSLNRITSSKLSGELTMGKPLEGFVKNGELYLVNNDKIMITESMSLDDASFRQVVDTMPVRKVLEEEKEMTGIYPNYQGMMVVGASADITEYGWILLAEIDKSEAFAPIRIVGIVAFIVGGLCAAVAIGGGIVFSLSAARPIGKLKYATDRFAKGDMDYRVKVINNDEIGGLGNSFNNMADELKILTESLEKRIAERTVKLTGVNNELLKEITERKRVEGELRKLTRAVEQSPASVIITDIKGSIEYINPKFTQTTGYTLEEVVGKSPSILKSGEQLPEVYVDLWDTIKSGGEWSGEFHNKKKNGKLFWEFASISPIRNADGIITHFIAVKEDITELKKMEEELRELNKTLEGRVAQRTVELRKTNEDLEKEITGHKQTEKEFIATNKELEAFCYSVSHDLRAPLRSIDGFSRALVEDYADVIGPQGKDYLGRVRTASQHMGQLISDLLGLSRITRREMHREKVDLSEMVQKIVVELQRSHSKRRVEFVIAENVSANGDARLLQMALENLLSNAWKFTSKQSHARIEFGVTHDDNGTVYVVSDNGAGFDMAYAGKLFGAFQRLHSTDEFEGTGIGLATVQRIINRHGGRIWAKGAVGQGATFYFTV